MKKMVARVLGRREREKGLGVAIGIFEGRLFIVRVWGEMGEKNN